MTPAFAIHHSDDAGQGHAKAFGNPVSAFARFGPKANVAHIMLGEMRVGVFGPSMIFRRRVSVKHPKAVQKVFGGADNLKVRNAIVILDAVEVVHDHPSGDRLDESFHHDAVEFSSGVGETPLLDDKNCVSVAVSTAAHDRSSSALNKAITSNEIAGAISGFGPRGFNVFHAANYSGY